MGIDVDVVTFIIFVYLLPQLFAFYPFLFEFIYVYLKRSNNYPIYYQYIYFTIISIVKDDKYFFQNNTHLIATL